VRECGDVPQMPMIARRLALAREQPPA